MDLSEILQLKKDRSEQAQNNMIKAKASLISRYLGDVKMASDIRAEAIYFKNEFRINYWYHLPHTVGWERVIFFGDDTGLVENIYYKDNLVYKEKFGDRCQSELEVYRPGIWEKELSDLAEIADKRGIELRNELDLREKLADDKKRTETIANMLNAFGPI